MQSCNIRKAVCHTNDRGSHVGCSYVNTCIPHTASVRHTDAMVDNTLSIHGHITQMCKGAWHQHFQIGKIRPYLHSEAAETLMHLFVSSWPDNLSFLYGVLIEQLCKL